MLFVSATGSGTSLAYQVPALLIEGCTLLVSPLLALQHDQLDALPQSARTRGARLSSAETPAQRRTTLEAAVRGELEFLAISPEQLANDEVRARLAEVRPERHAELIASQGRRVAVYHAGLGAGTRKRAHEAFRGGELHVVVATSAFGMGIDKADVRYVVHAEVPESPDTDYQEVGRAGRDDQPCFALLCYRPEDLSLARFFSGGIPDPGHVTAMVHVVARDPAASRAEVVERTGLGPRRVGRILNLRADVLRSGEQRPGDGDGLVAAVVAHAEAQRRLERSRVDMMRAYTETDRCRMEFLLGYFGEQVSDVCGRCDRCEAGTTQPAHAEDVGYRTLDADLVQRKGLLRTA